MNFESSARVYEAVNLLRRGSDIDVYSCKSGGKKYILHRIKSDGLKRSASGTFAEISETLFDGFAEIFTDKDELMIAFYEYAPAETEADIFGEDIKLSEKTEFFRAVISCFCIHSVPTNIACDLLLCGNIGKDACGETVCRYELTERSFQGRADMGSLLRVFIQKMTEAFSETRYYKRGSLIREFLGELESDPPENILDLYDRYCVFSKLLMEEAEKTGFAESDKKNKALKFAGKTMRVLKIVFRTALPAIALLIFIMTLAGERPQKGSVYRQIGEVNIVG